MFRVLKPGGKALITVPQWNELHEEPHDYFRYTCFGLKTMCEDAGFSVLKIDQRGKYHACRAQMKIRYWIDRLKPYERKWAMLIMAPLSMLCTKYALFRDNMNQSTASAKHAIERAEELTPSQKYTKEEIDLMKRSSTVNGLVFYPFDVKKDGVFVNISKNLTYCTT